MVESFEMGVIYSPDHLWYVDIPFLAAYSANHLAAVAVAARLITNAHIKMMVNHQIEFHEEFQSVVDSGTTDWKMLLVN